MSLLKNTLFYAYDVVLFLTYLLLYSRLGEPLLKATVCSVGVSVVLQAVLSPLAPEQAFSRRALFFNDENQLGYYCVLSGTIFVLGTRRFPVRLRYQVPVYGAIGYLTVVSQCRGALAGLAVLVVLAVLERPFRLLLVVTGLTAAYAALTLAPAVVGKSGERLVTQGEYDTLSTRGYDRLLNYPEHVFFGAGEGAYGRFHSELYGTELHSSFGTLLFCYGLLGTGFFTYGLFRIAKGDPKSALFVIPAFVHGSAHHGLRFAFFWAMLAFLCCIALGRKPPGPESFPSGYEGEPDPAPGAFAGGGDPCLQTWRETAC
jgi:hypothetical protein